MIKMNIPGKIIFKCIVGSRAYGTNIETSDTDYKGVYMQNQNDLLGFGYKEQIDHGKDECYYEVRRFLQLLETANPTVLEMLFIPDHCIIESSPEFDLLKKHRTKFLTKKCLNSFGGYAVAQIKKAKGMGKKMNWENSKVTRKSPIDFVYAYESGKTFPITTWLKREGLNERYCGLVGLQHFKDCYALYYDYSAHYGSQGNRTFEPWGFHGIVLEDSNDIRLSSVPKGIEPRIIVNYNKDGYSKHCKDFNHYQEWLENRNTQRYVDVDNHNQKIDGKNLLHCRRLLDTATEIAKEGTISVFRPNASYLLQIRRGKISLESIIENAEHDLKGLNVLYEKSDLPESVDKAFVNDLLLQVRKL